MVMTQGEKLVWAATFAECFEDSQLAGSAASRATRAVLALRLVHEKCDLDGRTNAMVAEMCNLEER